MSKRKVASRCLVIDASIACPAGSLDAKHPTAIACYRFLMSVRAVCHRMAWTDAIKREWEEHRSTFATQWLASMQNLRKLRDDVDATGATAIDEIAAACSDDHVKEIVLKDCHLIEAALATDRCVISHDDNARGHFSRLKAQVECLKTIIWVDPTQEDAAAVEWLERGAPAEKKRLLNSR